MKPSEAYKVYHELIDKLKKTNPYGLYNTLRIADHYKNFRNGDDSWEYNRHHICEIDITGAGIKDTKYANTEAIIVDTETHSLLHYLIVIAGKTRPNWGMLLQFDRSFEKWEGYIKSGCKKHDIPFIADWQKYINR